MLITEAFRSCWLVATFGFGLFLGGAGILFWNEGRAVDTIMSLDEAMEDAVSLDVSEETENSYSGRIVHITGPIVVGEPLTEPDYDIQVLAVKLRRHVQMYQWIEETLENNYGESVATVYTDQHTYYYTTDWRDKVIDSRSFYIQTGHRNPDRFPVESETQIAKTVLMGRYELGHEIKQKFNNYVAITSDTRPEDASIKLHLGLYYHTNDVFNPEVGDIRLLFSFAGMEGEVYTIVGNLDGRRIIPYESSRGGQVLLVYPGSLDLQEAFKREHNAQRLTTWSFRFAGWVFIFFGVTCTSTLLHILLSGVSVLRRLAPDPLHPVGANFLLSLSMALTIAAVAWLLHRPMVGAGLIIAAASPFLWCARRVAEYQHVN